MYYDILDKKRLGVLPKFKSLKNDFYLAGGTALALYLGHRDSIDFDFFTPKDIDTEKLFTRLKEIFSEFKILKIQEEKNTLAVLVDDDIKISFFSYPYELLKHTIDEENFSLASIEDIACMKLSAIIGRAANKDYIDLYFILKKFDLKEIIELAKKKFPDIEVNLILKSLVYFKDVQIEPISFKHDSQIDFAEVKKFLVMQVKNSGLN